MNTQTQSQRFKMIADGCAYRCGALEAPIWLDLAFAALYLANGTEPRRFSVTFSHTPAR